MLAAHTIVANIVQFCFMLPLGFAIAGATRVGNFLGAGRPMLAKQSVFTLLILIFFVYVFNSSLTFACRYLLAQIYTDDPEVVSDVANVMPLISFCFLFVDPFQGSLAGVLR